MNLTEELSELTSKILKQNPYVKRLLLGEECDNKPHHCENWLQVEIAKRLSKVLLKDVFIEVKPYNLDILIKQGCVSKGIEIKINGSAKDIEDDINNLTEFSNGTRTNQGYLLLLMLFKEKPCLEELLKRASVRWMDEVMKKQINPLWIKGQKRDRALAIFCLEIK